MTRKSPITPEMARDCPPPVTIIHYTEEKDVNAIPREDKRMLDMFVAWKHGHLVTQEEMDAYRVANGYYDTKDNEEIE